MLPVFLKNFAHDLVGSPEREQQTSNAKAASQEAVSREIRVIVVSRDRPVRVDGYGKLVVVVGGGE